MSMTTAPARGRLPRWALALIVLLVVVTALAVAVATFAVRGKAVLDPPAASLPSPTHSEGAGSPITPPDAAADGCLGGATDLDAAVIAAQEQAPLTPQGAAEFTAALVRWAGALPPSRAQKSLGRRLLTTDSTRLAGQALNSAERTWPAGRTARLDFTQGRYYVEDFKGTEAAVTYFAGLLGTSNGQRLPDAEVAGTLHLRAVAGHWRLFDISFTRTIVDAKTLGSPYMGGC